MWDRVRAEVALGQEMVAPPCLIRQLVNLKLSWTHNLKSVVLGGAGSCSAQWPISWFVLGSNNSCQLSCGQGRGACGLAWPRRVLCLLPCPQPLRLEEAQLPEGSMQTHRPADPRGLGAASSNSICNGLETEATAFPKVNLTSSWLSPHRCHLLLSTFLLSSHLLPSRKNHNSNPGHCAGAELSMHLLIYFLQRSVRKVPLLMFSDREY